jgi:very-short-patch-repair endonuclease
MSEVETSSDGSQSCTESEKSSSSVAEGVVDHAAYTPTSTDESPPLLPNCEKLRGVKRDQGYITCLTVYRELGNHSAQTYLYNRLRHAQEKGLGAPLHQLVPNIEWDSKNHAWVDTVFPEWEWCVASQDLPGFVKWAQGRTRKGKEEKKRLFAKFLVDIADDEVKVPIELEVLDLLQQCIPFHMEKQYRVGKYRLDAFIPRLRIAIQIDEGGHKHYQAEEEKIYEEVIRDAHMVLIRFNPDSQLATELVKQVWTRTISPDFSCFREKNRLH